MGSWNVCQIFDFANYIWSKVVECIFPLKWIHQIHFCSIFLSGFASQGVLDKDHIVLLHDARPDNTCTPHSWEHACTAVQYTYPKNSFASIKIGKIWWNTFVIKNQRKSWTKSLLATVSLLNMKFDIFTCLANSVPMSKC